MTTNNNNNNNLEEGREREGLGSLTPLWEEKKRRKRGCSSCLPEPGCLATYVVLDPCLICQW